LLRKKHLPILLIDNSAFSQRLAANMLKKLGLSTVIICETPIDAWSELDQNPDIRLVLTALRLPEIEDGLEMIRTLRTRFPSDKLPIVVLSNSTDKAHVTAAQGAGANDYIFKPVTPEVLETRLAAALDLPLTTSQLIGEHLVRRGLITAEQRAAALRYQRLYGSEHLHVSVLALYLGFVDEGTLSTLFLEQRFDESAFLRRAKELGLADAKIQQLMALKRRHNIRFGDALVRLRFIRREVLEDALKHFYKHGDADA